MYKIIALTVIAFAIGVFVGWAGLRYASSHPHQATTATPHPAMGEILAPLQMMRDAGQLPAAAYSDPY
jgi:hypothetical protein